MAIPSSLKIKGLAEESNFTVDPVGEGKKLFGGSWLGSHDVSVAGWPAKRGSPMSQSTSCF